MASAGHSSQGLTTSPESVGGNPDHVSCRLSRLLKARGLRLTGERNIVGQDRGKRGLSLGVCLMAAATIAVAGCGSSKHNAGTTSSTTAGSSATTASSSGGVPPSVDSTVTQFEGSPNLGLTPLASTPPTGKSLVYLANTNAPTDVMNGQAAAAAAQLLGWHL